VTLTPGLDPSKPRLVLDCTITPSAPLGSSALILDGLWTLPLLRIFRFAHAQSPVTRLRAFGLSTAKTAKCVSALLA
jgi:hypothetical protein